MATAGYYRFPTIHANTVVFVSEDDLWSVPADGGTARRLSSNLGAISSPFLSPDGSAIAFTGREEGNSEVYTMPAEGGPVRRVTYLGVSSAVVGWTPDGARILFSSDAGQPFDRMSVIYAVSPDGGEPETWPVGLAMSISVAAGNRTLLGRNNNDPARWKRYRGGTAGEIWVDAEGAGQFRRLLPELRGNLARPMWVGDRVFFLSDHEGVANLYSCLPSGDDLRRHTHHADYFARFPGTDGRRIVYHAGADLYVCDPAVDGSRRVEVGYHSPRVQRQRKFVDPARYLETYAPHPEGHSLAVTTRGKSFTLGNWEGAVMQQGGYEANGGVRYRLTRWLSDGRRVVTVTDVSGEDALEVHDHTESGEPVRLAGLDIGRPTNLRVSPARDQVVLSNHRNELVLVDLVEKTMTVLDRSPFHQVHGIDWSPDGRWVAYDFAISANARALKLWDSTTGETHTITQPLLADMLPAFDPEGKYLYFLAQRDFNPVYDQLHFDLGFPKGMRPFLVTLKKDLRSPFTPEPHSFKEPGKPEEKAEGDATANGGDDGGSDGEAEAAAEDAKGPEAPKPVEIDLDGIADRVVGFPVPEGIYGQICGTKGKALFTSFPVEGSLQQTFLGSGEPEAKGAIEVYDFEALKHEPMIGGVTDFQLSQDASTLVYRAGNRLRAVKAAVKPDEKQAKEPPGRRSGWIELNRIRISVEPGAEWRQMAREAWRLQREFFWTPDMSSVDWNGVWERYAPLVDRVGTRGEFSDLLWEMQGELGTSHAYEMGGDYRPEPFYPQGFLGADLTWDEAAGGWRVARVLRGTPGDPEASSPLAAPGVNVREGDVVRALNGVRLTATTRPQELLVHQADVEVILNVQGPEGAPRDVTVKTMRTEFPARYRDWVEANRRRVHDATGGRVGYVHIPDMGARGYAEFHRLYLTEVDRDALLVDVRFNRGGHVSQLLIEKLARKRLGYDITRWGQPEPYPGSSVAGPLVALTNQFAGSDGDIFSHVFKLMNLGPLIGKRTWGGVIGIWPRNPLADGSITTQPEFSFWFRDVGWGVENYGTDPVIEVDIAPQDYAAGRDPQLEKGIEVILRRLEEEPPIKPDFGRRPSLAPPPLVPGA